MSDDQVIGHLCNQTSTARALYLDLLETCLTGFLYEDPPLDPWHGVLTNERGERVTFGQYAGVIAIEPGAFKPEIRANGLDWPLRAPTMIGASRLAQLRAAVEDVISSISIPGDFIETGVWRGGACILMRGVLQAYGITDRRVFCADSFEGLPKPSAQDRNDYHHTMAPMLAVSEEEVRRNFARYGLLDDQVVFVKGWFEDSLPKAPIDKLAILRLDGDMYKSTWDALSALYDKVSLGGYVIVDDYRSVRGCQNAVNAFRAERKIEDPIQGIDPAAVYWRKGSH